MKYAIGLDIGGTKTAAGIVNENGDLIQKEIVPSDVADKESMFQSIVTCMKQLLNHSSIPLDAISGIGAGVPGLVDRKNGIAIYQNNLPWGGFPFVKRMRDTFQIDNIVIDNDVDMAAFAEWKEAGLKQDELFVYITISTGIACSIIQGGKFLRGAGFSGELGLIPVKTADSLERLEHTAAGPAVEKKGRDLFNDETLTAKDIFSAYNGGSADKKQLIDQMVVSLAHGVYMVNSLLDPHKIVFGGSVAAHNPYLLSLLKKELANYLIDEQKHILNGMTISGLGNEQGIIGAGLRVFEC